MAVDYSVLFKSEDGLADTWREVYEDSLPLSWNLLNIRRCTILLPNDFYDLIAAYFLLPSALCRTIPYLFLCGQSGSGKSTAAKLGSLLHGVNINSSSDSFAGIRNSLSSRRWGIARIEDENAIGGYHLRDVERNTCMIWDDIDSSVFTRSPDLYRLFKFGFDKSTDTITVSGKETGDNIEFHTFCPKIFSSISPLHLDDRFKELKRRLIVIPCKRVEELSPSRKEELNVTSDNWQGKLLDLNTYDWHGFNQAFEDFWNLDQGKAFIETRKILGKTVKGLGSQQRAISLDLMATGIVSGVWEDEQIAIERIQSYWRWFKQETEQNTGLEGLLKNLVTLETKNARNGNRELQISTTQIRYQISIWVEQGWLYEKPKPKQVHEILLDLGMRFKQKIWRKR